MNTDIKEGDLVWVNRNSIAGSMLVMKKLDQTRALNLDFSILGIVIRTYPEMYVVWNIEDGKEHYYYYEDVKLCQE